MNSETVPAKRHCGLGIASFVIALVTSVLAFLLFAVAGYLHTSGGNTESANVIVGITMIFCWFVYLVAFGLGVAGFLDKSSKRAFPITGMIISGGMLILSIVVVGIGISMSH
jgi:hypothetical protein